MKLSKNHELMDKIRFEIMQEMQNRTAGGQQMQELKGQLQDTQNPSLPAANKSTAEAQ